MEIRFHNVALLMLTACLAGCQRPAQNLDDLNGCYEAVGLPDFMRPSIHWVLRMEAGKVVDRSGKIVSVVTLRDRLPKSTKLGFQPGINLTVDAHKMSVVTQGNITSGWAAIDRRAIILGDKENSIIQSTSCG